MFTAENDHMLMIAHTKIDEQLRAAALRREAADARAERRAARRAERSGHGGPAPVRRFRMARRQA
jgi:hypothetical protein